MSERREDMLEELLANGSRNFRRYRRRAFAGFALLAAATTVALWQGQVAIDRQAEGRRQALNVVCGSVSAVSEAGRATIAGSASGSMPTEFERNLERLGYPPKAQRQKAANAAARAYSKAIADAVAREAGVRGIVRPDGSLNCAKLRRVGDLHE